MKKLFLYITILAVILCTCMSAGAATIYQYGDWSLSLLSGYETYTFGVRSYIGTDTVVELPKDYGGYPIKAVCSYAFAGDTKLTEVTIGDGYTEIGAGAFLSSAVETVTLSESMSTIGDSAFANCDKLTKIVIPASVTDISDSAFIGSDNAVIYCFSNSSAYEYAVYNELDYVLLDSPETYVLGDTDGDGEITILDVTLIQRRLVGISVPNPEIIDRNGDINGDGLDITDATWIQRLLAGMDILYSIGERVSVG